MPEIGLDAEPTACTFSTRATVDQRSVTKVTDLHDVRLPVWKRSQQGRRPLPQALVPAEQSFYRHPAEFDLGIEVADPLVDIAGLKRGIGPMSHLHVLVRHRPPSIPSHASALNRIPTRARRSARARPPTAPRVRRRRPCSGRA